MSRNSTSARHGSAQLMALLAVLAAAAFFRLWQIGALPPGFHFDESFEGLEAWRILTDPSYRPIFLTGNFGVTPLNAYANALTFWLFERLGGEAGPTAMRVTAAFFGVLGVLSVYALAGELRRLDRRAGGSRLTHAFPLLAAAALATMRWHIHFSRMGIEPILVPLLWAGATWLLLRGMRTGSLLSFAGCGALAAAAMYAYQGAWVIPLLMPPTAALVLWSGPAAAGLPRPWTGLLVAAGVAALLFLPLALYLISNLELALLRPAQIGVVGQTESPTGGSLGQAVPATLGMFAPFGQVGDMDPRRNLPGAPALNIWQALPFYAGAALALWRIRRPAYSIPLLGLIGLLSVGFFSEYAPHFHRILGAAAPTALLIGLGLDSLAAWVMAESARPAWRAASGAALALLLFLGAVTSARDYFVRWGALPDLFYAFDVGLWELGQSTAALPAAEPLYVSPRGSEHTTLAFAWRNRAAPPIRYDGRHVLPLTRGENTAIERYAVVVHEDFRTPLLLPEVLPSVLSSEEVVDDDGEVYARIYTRPVGAAAARPPQTPLAASLGDGIALAGFDVLPERLTAGEVLYLQLHWLADATPTAEWTVFTHLVDGAGEVRAGHDSPPGEGSLPTTQWRAGWRVLDEYQIVLPAELPPGEYLLRAGLYRADGVRLPATGPGVELGKVTLE